MLLPLGEAGRGYSIRRRDGGEAVRKTIESFRNSPESEYLWNAKPRFGKTLAVYDLCMKMQFRNVLVVTGKTDNDEIIEDESSLMRVRKAIAEHPQGTITLSVGQLTTGVTIPEWTAVLILSNMKSPAQYMQTAFRAQTPHLYIDTDGRYHRKENAYVFDFDPARTLSIYEEMANGLTAETASGGGDIDTRKAHIRELLNFFPVIGEDEQGEMEALDAEQVMLIPRRIRSKEVGKKWLYE